ncbi:hypothetical protein BDV38DRAFT_287603 [Aspergillus pseudotamarii]|uniref:Uncharacterized protein n=1 Tax=Aspergillus pseudotamarii TaxID=132259 RepID=A0A5N6SF46_ASPPS|nr:uncharacterized protein BDV38DRAFT_287603 [Aspergillus pseudotamarii]KAE8132567.1 hypothetical protein BDV38DRAFT_287603 [Aspergillus pseudotamarii]
MTSIFGVRPRNDTAARWESEPNARGTWAILSSSLITLALCVWTAVHLNLPGHGKSNYTEKYRSLGFLVQRWPKLSWLVLWWRKAAWLVLGIFAPEVVIFAALGQWTEAHRLTRIICKAYQQDRSVSWIRRMFRRLRRRWKKTDLEAGIERSRRRSRRLHQWTKMHSFLVVMGGVVFDTGEMDFLPAHRTRLTILPRGIMTLAEHAPHLIPDISGEEIKDKSKADGVTKALMCIQAFWFCVQTFARINKGIYISLLEWNTLVHAVCALIMYGIWWHKPLDVSEPLVISGPQAMELCAAMCTMSNIDGCLGPFLDQSGLAMERGDLRMDCSQSSPKTQLATALLDNGASTDHTRWELTKAACLKAKTENWQPEYGSNHQLSQLARGFLCLRSSREFTADKLDYEGVADRCQNWGGTLRWLVKGRQPISGALGSPYYHQTWHPVWVWAWLSFGFSGIIYGSLHLLAWDAPFHSAAEKTLWHMCSLVITCYTAWKRFVVPMFFTLYIFSRLFLVVECFVNLAFLPREVYETLQWAEYIPHIS